MPACIFQNGQAAAFIGKDGRRVKTWDGPGGPLDSTIKHVSLTNLTMRADVLY